MRRQPIERFHARYTVDPQTGCWNWSGIKQKWQYGVFVVDGKRWGAHRWALYHLDGPFDLSLDVMHTCDNPACVNPKHLRAVTTQENLLDMGRKRRQWRQVSGWCLKGLHDLSIPGSRTSQNACRECNLAWQRAWNKRRRQERSA